MQVRKRLLFGSLAVSAVASVAVGFMLADRDAGSSNSTVADGTEVSDTRPAPDIGGIDTNAVVEGKQLPDVTLQNLAGDDIATSSLIGTPMVINVWGSTCIPCREELPAFASAHAKYGNTVRFVGLDFLGASTHEEEFARSKGVDYELLYDGNGEFISAAGIAAFPVTLFVNVQGVIVRQTGQLDEATLAKYIESDLG